MYHRLNNGARKENPNEEKCRFVFSSPRSGERYVSDREYREKFLYCFCQNGGVMYRSTRYCRHTFASILLTAGEPLNWVSLQLGHKDEATTRQSHTKWSSENRPNMNRMVDRLMKEMKQEKQEQPSRHFTPDPF